MKAFVCILLLAAACVLSSKAVKIQPQRQMTNSMESSVSMGSDESTLAHAETACAYAFNQAQQYNNQQVSEQTTACLQPAIIVVDPQNPATLAQVANVRNNLTSLQTNLASCLSIIDNLEFVTCVANGNDVNQNLLNNANENAQNAEGQLSNSSEQTSGSEKNCINHVLGHAKSNLTNAANNYNKCLENVLNNPISN